MKTPDTKSIANEMDAAVKSPAHTKYLHAKTRVEELRSELDAAQRELTELFASPDPDEIGAAAEALLNRGGTAVAVAMPAKTQAIATLKRKVSVLERAIELAVRSVKDLNYERSDEAGKSLRQIHERIVVNAAEALKQAAIWLDAEENFRREAGLRDLKIGGCRPLGFPADIGHPDNPHSAIGRWLDEARRFNYQV